MSMKRLRDSQQVANYPLDTHSNSKSTGLQTVAKFHACSAHTSHTPDPFAISLSYLPELPDPSELVTVLTEKDTESFLVVYPLVEDSLKSLNAAKPPHSFPTYKQRLHKTGYKHQRSPQIIPGLTWRIWQSLTSLGCRGARLEEGLSLGLEWD